MLDSLWTHYFNPELIKYIEINNHKYWSLLNHNNVIIHFLQLQLAHQVTSTRILMENTAAEQIERKKAVAWTATCVMEVRLASIVAAAKIMIMLNVYTKNASIIKMQSQMSKVT